jgi:hypothetical protein
MKTTLPSIALAIAGALLVAPLFAAEPTPGESPTSPGATQANDSEMMKQMMELSKLNENHKLLSQLAGDWSYQIQMWMAPGAPALKSSGTSSIKPLWGGRYYVTHSTGQMRMPGADGKMQSMTFKGMGVDGYDNAKKKFVSSWIDNFGTGIVLAEGDYDPASKTFTYNTEEEMAPGMKTKVRETVKVVDKDHLTFSWYENRGGREVKTMELDCTRAK